MTVERRIPDATLMARLQLSVKGVDWAAALLRDVQHVQPGGEWSAHQHVFHLLGNETEVFQPRIVRLLGEEAPRFARWDAGAYMRERYSPGEDIGDLAERFMSERERTVAMLRAAATDDWRRVATWPDGRTVDLAWVAERVLWHALDHFAGLLNLHGDLVGLQSTAWFAAPAD